MMLEVLVASHALRLKCIIFQFRIRVIGCKLNVADCFKATILNYCVK